MGAVLVRGHSVGWSNGSHVSFSAFNHGQGNACTFGETFHKFVVAHRIESEAGRGEAVQTQKRLNTSQYMLSRIHGFEYSDKFTPFGKGKFIRSGMESARVSFPNG